MDRRAVLATNRSNWARDLYDTLADMNDPTTRKEFEGYLRFKTQGGVEQESFVSDSIGMGGMIGAIEHAPLVALGPPDWDGHDELTFFPDYRSLDLFIEALRKTAAEAWGEPKASN